MAISRKIALRKIADLVPQVVKHLAWLAEEKESQDRAHWIHEVLNWLAQMEEMVPHVGKKTGAEWQARIEAWKAQVHG